MIDRNKRSTLKKMAVGTGVLGTGALSAVVTGSVAIAGQSDGHSNLQADEAEPGNIEVTTRVSAIHNDLEIVLTNTGRKRVNITRMTPHSVRVARGEFELSALLENGPLTLESGQSASVPLKRMPLERTQLHSLISTPTVTDKLKQSMSVIVDDNAFASVTLAGVAAV